MATRSFLLDSDLDQARALLLEGVRFPQDLSAGYRRLSDWLESRLLQRLSRYGDFLALRPVVLGSWSRRELCPRSDIDLIFLGPEDAVRAFVGQAYADGCKLRSRVPEDPADWTVGVKPFDVLALFTARGLDSETQDQIASRAARLAGHRSAIVRAIRTERDQRRKRLDSITHFLEPNLKYGAGGLRDVEQALAMKTLYPERFAGRDPYPFRVLTEVKEDLLFLRSWLHLHGGGEILSAADQLELVKALGLPVLQDLTTHVQRQLERGSFYADWVVAIAHSGFKRADAAARACRRFPAAVRQLRESPDIFMQFELRRRMGDLTRDWDDRTRGKWLHKLLQPPCDDAFLVALRRTRLLGELVPDFKRLRGLVQHDHYHRYTADAHLLQALREVVRLRKTPKVFGPMGRLTKGLGAGDWWVLKLTALFHDLAKGRGGDHSEKGAALVEREFTRWNYASGLKDDVKWMVENHLALSTAAFRENPRAHSTWQRLFEKGVVGRRLILLALFTAVDIRATNPDAWTDWKSQLLFDLVESLRSPGVISLRRHLDYLRAKPGDHGRVEDLLLTMDPLLIESLPPRVLIDDLNLVARTAGDCPPRIVRLKSRPWVRFHRRQDARGLFFGYVRKLFGLGLPINIASVQTLDGVGVYDWFQVRSDKTIRQIERWLNQPDAAPKASPKVVFQAIDWVARDPDEWVLSFRGRDQRGLLVSAAEALSQENLSVRWARAHTWGQQVEDTFGVQPFGEPEAILSRLRARFVT